MKLWLCRRDWPPPVLEVSNYACSFPTIRRGLSVACCPRNTKATSADAVVAFLYAPERSIAHPINGAAWTGSYVQAETVARAVAITADRFGTNSFPTARTSAMQEERIDGILTYTGTRTEISEYLRKHADGRDASMDPRGASAMRAAADEIENGERTEFRSKAQAHYLVVEPSSSDKAGEPR